MLEKLNLLYKPMPHDAPPGVVIPKELVARKASIEKLTDLWCSELRRHRLRAYKRKLQSEQPDFLMKKAEKLRFIMKEEQELGLEATVTQEQVDECIKKAEEIKSLLESEADKEEEYLIYEEEIEEESLTFKK